LVRKYVVRLSSEEREQLETLVRKESGAAAAERRASRRRSLVNRTERKAAK
jgi:hypothetical protein